MYPGTAIRRGDARADLVRMIQTALGDDGWDLVATDGVFGPRTESAVKLFQTRHGLEADGIVGPVTWAALFGMPAPVHPMTNDPLLNTVIQIARAEVGVREQGGPNRGPRVEEYLAAVGKPPGRAWCVAFAYFSFMRAAEQLKIRNPMYRTAGVHDHWNNAHPVAKLPPSAALDDLRNITPGTLGHIDHGEGRGHIFIVVAAEPYAMRTIEGNTNVAGSREGDGVYYSTRRYREVNLGYVDYSRA